jgi:hypothetical protein
MAGLPPAGHTGVHQLGIARLHRLRPQAQTLGHTGAIAFDQGIRAFAQLQHQLHAFRLLQIHHHGAAIAQRGILRAQTGDARGAFDGDYLCPHIREHHRAKRCWAYARQFNHAKTF